MNDQIDLKKILSDNIKTARKALQISQMKLAEFANISVSYMTDIEYGRTWVSDKTLRSIAAVLNKEPYELLFPSEGGSSAGAQEKGNPLLEEIAVLIKEKKAALRTASDEIMDDLLIQIIRLYAKDLNRDKPA